jgi:Holliday junction resolvase-like predicted endonuclease
MVTRMAEDIGESLVGSYLRYVQNCEFVLFNTFLPGEQGEIDVIGIRLGTPRDIYFAEVTTHIQGMTYGGNKSTVDKVRSKLERAEKFAQDRFPGDRHHYEVWSPRVPVGAMTKEFTAMSSAFQARGARLTFVMNEGYGDRVQALIEVAKTNSRATSDPAFRLLQVLARVRTAEGELVF